MPRLKAVFFVHDFAGDAKYVERKSFVEPLPGRRIEIRFLDDELMLGATLGYRNDGTGFFVTGGQRRQQPAGVRASGRRAAGAVRVRLPASGFRLPAVSSG
jgi:hypothetical protein